MRFRNAVCSLPVLCLHPACSLPASPSVWELWDAAGNGFQVLLPAPPAPPHKRCHLCFSCPECAFLCFPWLPPKQFCLVPLGSLVSLRGLWHDSPHPSRCPCPGVSSIHNSHEQLFAPNLPLWKTGAVLCGDKGGKIIPASGKATSVVSPRGGKAVGGLGGTRLRLCTLRAQFAAGEGGSVVTLSPPSLQSPSTCAATSAAASTPTAQPRASTR